MKALLLFGFISVLQATTIAVGQKINLIRTNIHIENALLEISRQSEKDLVYNSQILKNFEKKSFRIKNTNLTEALDIVLKNQPLSYEIVKNAIVIKPKKYIKANSYHSTTIAPQQQISGRITDIHNQPLVGVTITVKDSPIATTSDTNGHYKLLIPNTDNYLIFSMIGFESTELSIDGSSQLNVQLKSLIGDLEEVVVIGYGSQTKREISGSVTNVQEKDFNKGVNRNATDLLRGKVAGLTITSGSGDVSSGETIRLRGTSSLTGSSSPFVVIDGVPGLSINSVAPQDIESISVLKDASASAIYGSRSAGGVILITTKKGVSSNPLVNYDGYIGIDNVSNKPKMLSANKWREYVKSNNIDVEGIDKGANTDWFDEILRTGISHNHSLSLSGGGDNSSYRGAANYLNRQGVALGNDLSSLNGRLSFSQKTLNNKVEISMVGSMTERDYSPTDDRNFVLAYNMLPVWPVKNDDGSWFDSRGYDEGNPVRNLRFNKRDSKESSYYLNSQIKIDLLKNLVARINVMKERSSNDNGNYNHSETERGRDDQGFASRSASTSDRKLLETTLEYSLRTENSHNISLLTGYSYEDYHYQNSGAQSRQFVTNFFDYNNLGAGEILRSGDVWSGANMHKLISFFGRANYSFKDRYILSTSLRRDGSSKFGKNNKWGLFPSVSMAWNIMQEEFISKNVINDLKLRVGYGAVGNQDGLNPYQTIQLYAPSGRYYDNGTWYESYRIGQNANPDLKWEETAMFNIGLDYSLINGRINGTVEFYNKKTRDLLYTYQVPVPPYLYPSMIANVGTMSNKGVEVLINGAPISNEKFSWNVSFNFAHNKNRITKLSNENFSTSSIKLGSASVRGAAHTTTHIIEEGREVGTFFGWRNLGLDENGKYIMDDMIDGKPGLTDDDRTYIGSAQPKFTYGLNNNFSYKNFDFSFFLRGVYGNDVLNFSRMAYATTQWLPGGNVLEEALTNGLTDNPKYSSYNLEKGSFLRLDNASLGYNFKIHSIKHIKALRLYVNAQNLFIITNYKGLDPEVNMGGLSPGMESRNYYPKSKTFSFGANITF
ncbi:TonB-dependent receptor [Sphingobacterium sp. UT-1RO-CII-1]|uniref:TonB-dependent receptor n=1 Tax=Sphingobacterium sp. UT-1RO-CII-1 TaxID=2995225 RepID=UPI00227A04E3|nr:TonB-dependent receptor [Sphingobacterium sp. UT-1RO-CII-1]MCY4778770.1 TonB-dependent receptor [Sphingobacterium sp. UT-1RO-CII-1]